MGIFKMVDVTSEQVIIKVNAKSNLDIARHPYISKEYDYITVSRGDIHILTITKTDGTTSSFYWGADGHTCISKILEQLQENVKKFIKDNYILLNYSSTSNPDKCILFFNNNYNKWQLNFEYNNKRIGYVHFGDNNVSAEEAESYSENFIGGSADWNKKVSPTGIDTYECCHLLDGRNIELK